MKRHQVMEIFHRSQTEAYGEWIDVKRPPDKKSDKVMVRCQDGSERFCYYYRDPPSFVPAHQHFWCCCTKEAIEGVTFWKKVRSPTTE